MGYELHITRREHWTDDGNDIQAEEWLAYVSRHPELQLDLRNGPYHILWNGSEDHWLDWYRGELFTKWPDKTLILKMVEIAKHLNAQVQGDDGEYYPESLAQYLGDESS